MTSPAANPQNSARRARDRSALLNQVMVGGVVILATCLSLAVADVKRLDQLMLGLLLTFAATGVAFLVPWERGPSRLVLVLPLIDIIAIMLLCIAAPESGFPLLWMFPAMWIGSSLGTLGVIIGTTVITAAHWGTLALADQAADLPAFVLLPVVVAGLATIASVASWRSGAQRIVLEKQSRELRRAVERARAQEDLVTEVLDAVDFGVIRLTDDGETMITNEAIGRLQSAIEGTDRMSAYASDGITPISSEDLPLARARRGEDIGGSLIWFGDPGAPSRRALRFTSRRMVDKDLSSDGALLVAQDITAEELAVRAREDLIASVSHELRTPLTSITGYVDLVLEDDRLPESARRDLRVVERNAERLLTIVSDLLAASAMSRTGVALSLHLEDTELADVIEASVESALPRAAERAITITVRTEPVLARVDPHRIRQVIDNLVSNAVKYGSTGGRLDVELTRDEHQAIIIVRDDGPGIPDGEVPRLFERFFRSDLVRQSVIHGSGLGLSISRDIVRAHNGELTVRTALGRGSEFTVHLPAQTPREET